MKTYNELPLYKQSTGLVTLLVQLMGKTSRQYRFTFGERMVEAALKLPVTFHALYTEASPEKKEQGMDCFMDCLVKLKILVDIGHQLGLFNYKDFPVLLERIDSIERQIVGFKNKNAKVSVIKG